LGHPLALLEQLRQPPWEGVLAVQPLLMVLDAARWLPINRSPTPSVTLWPTPGCWC